MARNLDLTALRAFVTVAECGGVTKAASMLHLTQSAVSMQLKRLEEALGQSLYSRVGRTLVLTSQGEQLLGYGRRMLSLNDEVWGLMTRQDFEGEIRFGVPHDIVYPHIPNVLQRMAADFPRVKVQLSSSSAWRQRPLRLAFEYACLFRAPVQEALDKANIRWEMGVESDSSRTVEASISADLAIHACLEGSAPQYMEEIRHGGELPELPTLMINAYQTEGPAAQMASVLGDMISECYQPTRTKVA